jgi:hypothetical protein
MKRTNWFSAKVALIIITLSFAGKEIAHINAFGKDPLGHADGFSEALSRTGANNFIKDGLFETAMLPVWPQLEQETPIQKLKDSHVYTHYFPGPDYYVTLWFWIFGNSDTSYQWSRLGPLFCIIFSVLALTWSLSKTLFIGWEWSAPTFALLVFFVPALNFWSINLHGHAFSTTVILLAFAMGNLTTLKRFQTQRTVMYFSIFCFICGFISNYMLLTASFAVFFAPTIGACLSTQPVNAKLAFTLSFCVGLGLVGAFVVHLWQIAIYLDSWPDAIHEQFSTAVLRTTAEKVGPNRVMLIGQYSHHVRRFFWISSITMVLLGFFFVWLHESLILIKKQLGAALVLSFFAGYAWIMLLKNHSIDHPHVNPRIFMPLFVTWVGILVSVGNNRWLERNKPGHLKK